MFPLRSEEYRNQPYKVAWLANFGILIAEPAIEVPAASPSMLSSMKRLLRLTPPPPPQRKLYLPYGEEGTVRILEVIYLGENDLKFCYTTGMLPEPDFKGCTEVTIHRNEVDLFTQFPIRGFREKQRLHAVTRLISHGDRKQLRAVVEDIVPISSL